MDNKNRLRSLIIGYYLGELIDLSATPKEAWKNYLKSNLIKNYRYIHRGSIRIYSLFKNNKDQIYRTNHVTFWNLAEMSNHDFQNDLIRFVPIMPATTTTLFDPTDNVFLAADFLAQEDLSL
jgi:hypothetical protein